MSKLNSCRLCVNTCPAYKTLYDASGRSNEVYELIVKYFDSTILNTDMGKDLTVICLQCWGSLCDFDSFKQSICVAQSKLIKVETQAAFSVLPDNEESMGDMFASNNRTQDFSDSETQTNNREYVDIMEVSTEAIYNSPHCSNHVEDHVGGNSDKDEKVYITIPKLEKVDLDSSDDDKYLADCLKDMEAGRKNRKTNASNVSRNVKERQGQKYEYKYKKNISQSHDDDVSSDEDNNHTIRPYVSRITKEYEERIARWRPNLRCEVCNESQSRFTLLCEHFRVKHPNVECHVKCCEMILNRIRLIVDHIRLHEDPDVFQCSVCGQHHLNSISLNAHMSRLHTCPKRLRTSKQKYIT